MSVNGIYTGEFITQIIGYKVIHCFEHKIFHLFITSVSEAFPFEGMKNLGRSNIPIDLIDDGRHVGSPCEQSLFLY